MEPPEINFIDLVTPRGQRLVIDYIRDFRTVHGPEWLDEMRKLYPEFCRLVELVTTKTADEAHAEIVKDYPAALLFGSTIKSLHGILLEEIERKR